MLQLKTTRRSLLAGAVAIPSLLAGAERTRPGKSPKSSGSWLAIHRTPKELRLSNRTVAVVCDLESGLTSFEWNGGPKISGVRSAIELEKKVATTDYSLHVASHGSQTMRASAGGGRTVTVRHSGQAGPDMLQHFTFYEGKPFALVQVEVLSPEVVRTNYIGVIVADSAIDLGPGELDPTGDKRVLRVPFDNDMWFRYNAMDINSADVSCEATAIYENESRRGFVFGSVQHDTWKSGIRFRGAGGRIAELDVFAGLATPGVNSFTHDTVPHGKVSGKSVSSPAMFIGYYTDWRDGLEEYGRTNAIFKSPLAWTGPIPFGWNSWAAYTEHVSYSGFASAADFIAKELTPHGFQSGGVVYVNLDSYWSRLDAPELKDALEWMKGLGRSSGVEFRPGIYFTPFAQWGDDFDRFVEGTGLKYRYNDILLRKPDGTLPPKLAGGYALDPTHPGTQARIRAYITTFRDLGFQFIKLDFLSHGSLEGVHWDKKVETGIQAYNQGMKCVLDAAGGKMFISLSIAPLFPSGCGHARRISCDTMGHISGRNESTEYMLNSLTYGWWSNRSVYIADADEIPLGSKTTQGARTGNEARSRFLSAIISGGMVLDSSAFLEDEAARDLAIKTYTNRGVNALAGGKAFRPVEGNTGDQSADLFVQETAVGCRVAVFNFNGDAGTSKTIRFARVSKHLGEAAAVEVTDLWTGAVLGTAKGETTITLGPAEAKLLALVPRKPQSSKAVSRNGENV